MYKSYRASTSVHYKRDDDMESVLQKINKNGEEIVSVTSIGVDSFWVLIITRTPRNSAYLA